MYWINPVGVLLWYFIDTKKAPEGAFSVEAVVSFWFRLTLSVC